MKHILLRLTLGAFSCFSVCVIAQAETASPNDNGEIVLSSDVVTFKGESGTKDIKVLKGKNYKLFCSSDWMTCEQLKNGTLRITTKPYSKFYPRKASVVLTSKKTNYSKVLTVEQTDDGKRPEFMPKATGEGLCFLTDMDLTKPTFYYIKELRKNKSADGNPLMLKSTRYENGVGNHAPSIMKFKVNGAARFIADLAIDDEVLSHINDNGFGHVVYELDLDGKAVKKGKLDMLDNQVEKLNVDLKGAEVMTLRFIEDGSNYGDHVDLGNARFEYSGVKPETLPVDKK